MGDYVLTAFVPWENSPRPKGTDDFLTWMGRTGAKPSELSMEGWIAADEFVTGLRKAGPNFSRAALVSALNSGIYDNGGMSVPIDWRYQHRDPKKPGNRPPVECYAFSQVKSGNFVPALTDKGPWNCFDLHKQALDTISLDDARKVLEQGPLT